MSGTYIHSIACRDCLKILERVFTDLVLEDQNLFERDEQWEELLNLIPNEDVVKKLRSKWNDDEGKHSLDKWADVQDVIKNNTEKGSVERV